MCIKSRIYRERERGGAVTERLEVAKLAVTRGGGAMVHGDVEQSHSEHTVKKKTKKNGTNTHIKSAL